jgi:SAM-dependent methyltransferase
MSSIEARVIDEFGDQWVKFPENDGYYGSVEVLADILGSLGEVDEFRGKAVAEIGSGSGRIVRMLAEAGAASVIAIEPSEAMGPLKAYTKEYARRITYLQQRGDEWSSPNLDAVLSIGVLHHIHDPVPTVENALRNLKPGGKFFVWVYGYEGNELYLKLVSPLRKLTPKLPHVVLLSLVLLLMLPLELLTLLARVCPIPMRKYFLDHYGRLGFTSKRITIYDQLNPSWAKYYRRAEAESLLRDNGFVDVRSFHRHGYSWSVVGTKPSDS